MRIKSKDIALALNLSPATVSLVQNNRPGVSPETRQRVEDYLLELETAKYHERLGNQNTAAGTLLMLYYVKHGIIMTNRDNQAHELFFDKIRQEVTEAGYHFVYEEFFEKKQDLALALERWKNENIKGIYVMAAEMNESDIYPFQELSIPVVVGDQLFYEQGMDSFLIDNQEGIRRGVDYLVDKGHTHIVYLSESVDIFNFTERRKAFILEMARRECGDSTNRIRHLGNTIDEVYENMGRYLEEGIRKTTAFLLESSVVSLGVSKSLLEKNIKVPREISLVGFDALPTLSIPGIELTLIKGTHTKRHIAAVAHLLRHMNHEIEDDEMVRVYYKTRLLEGNSVFDKKKYIYK